MKARLLLEGQPMALRTPRDAAAHGISIVHQELLALTNLKISENIFAGRELCRAALFVDQAAQDQRSTAALRRLRKPMDVATETGRLSLGCRQVVEIARALDQGSRILILDEPTSALSASEAESLFEVIADLKRAGVTIIYISHRLHELLHLGDRFTVLRSGRVVGEATRAEATRAWIVERMSGRKEGANDASTATSAARPAVLTVSGLTLPGSVGDEAAQAPVHDVSFLCLRRRNSRESTDCWERDEPNWWKRLPDCGRSRREQSQFADRKIRTGSVRDALKAGMVLMPEDRQRDGLFPGAFDSRECRDGGQDRPSSFARRRDQARAQACGGIAYRSEGYRASRDHALGRKSAEGAAGALPDVLAVGFVDG